MTRVFLAGAMVLGIFGISFTMHREAHGAAAPACNVQGVWELESTTEKGRSQTVTQLGYNERKIMTAKYMVWLTQAMRRDTIPLRSYRDSVAHFWVGAGSGTYTLKGSDLTEHLDYFFNPSYIGKDVHATCRVEGGRWYHTFISPDYKDSTGRMVRDTTLEVYRRLE